MKLLLLNPNSSQAMTESMRTAAQLAKCLDIHIGTYTAAGPACINDAADILASTDAVLQDPTFTLKARQYDAILVACFSVHDLVSELACLEKPVLGLFEASILTALTLIGPAAKWGIITTGSFWVRHLEDGVADFLGGSGRFAGVVSTGLCATDFHTLPKAVVHAKIQDATRRLLSHGVSCVVLGCGGMVGMEGVIRAAADRQLHVVDGVKAGVLQLANAVKCRDLFRY